MRNIISDLGKEIEAYIQKSDEIYLAIALIDEYGLSIIENISKDKTVYLLLGVDLPTPVTVLERLLTLPFETKIYIDEKFFHPKMYLFKMNDSYVGFIGSANFTKAGLSENIEISYRIEDMEDCLSLKDWFDEIQKNGVLLDEDFLKRYGDIERSNSLDVKKVKELKSNCISIHNEKSLKVWGAKRINCNSDGSVN
ncbi:MAG: restriction endonuclease PLD domain-containing protein [Dysgonomonas sp.]